MQSDSSTSSRDSSRRHRSKEHKKKPAKHVCFVFREAGDRKPWGRADRIEISISEEQLEKELARGREAGKEPATIMSSLPSIQLKYITRLQAEINKKEKSSRYQWNVVSLWQDKPVLERGNLPQTMWVILRREKLEKKDRTSKSSSKQVSETEEQTHEELQQKPIQHHVPAQVHHQEASYYPQPGGVNGYCPHPAQPATQRYSVIPSIGGSNAFYASRYLANSLGSNDAESSTSGYSSEAESVSSNLTSGSTASTTSNTSIITPPPNQVPLRGILRKSSPTSSEVSVQSDTASEVSSNSVCSSGVNPNPSARSYRGTAPHAKKDFCKAKRSGRLPEYQLDTTSNTTLSTTRKTRFSDEASFCIAYDYCSESEEEVETYRPERRPYVPGMLARSKYVQYGSD